VLLTVVSLLLFVPLRWAERFLPLRALTTALARFWAFTALRALGIRVEQRGMPITGAAMVVANHSTWLDILALRTGPFLTFVAKEEVATWPGIGPIARLNGTMFVARRASAAKAQEEEMTSRLLAGEQLVFFPEGTSSDSRRVLPFKSALFASVCKPPLRDSVVVQPVSIAWVAPPDQPKTFFGWWGEMGLESNIWSVAARSFGSKVVLVWHSALDPNDFPNRKALAAAAERAVGDGLEEAGITPLLRGAEAWGDG
jgi:1-acyl-sn-glycerol-3-phosphate acyltransferase